MMYKVTTTFKDLKDKNHRYVVGDEYPRIGYKPSNKRIEELAGSNNKVGKPLIVEIPDNAEPIEEEPTSEAEAVEEEE